MTEFRTRPISTREELSIMAATPSEPKLPPTTSPAEW